MTENLAAQTATTFQSDPKSTAGGKDTAADVTSNELSDFAKWQKSQSKPVDKTNAKASTTGGEEKPAVEKAASADEKPVQEKPAGKVLKLNVNGQEIDFDTSDEAKLTAALQKGIAADRRLDEVSRKEKAMNNFIEALKSNPEQVLSNPKLGINLRAFAEDYLYRQIKSELASPEEKAAIEKDSELERTKQELAKYKEKEEAERKSDAEREIEHRKEKLRQEYSQQFIDALEKSGLPNNDWTVARMAQYMKAAIKQGFRTVTPMDVAERVRDDWRAVQQQMFSKLDGEKLIDLFGKENAEKIRKYYADQVQSPFAQFKAGNDAPLKSSREKPKTASVYDFVDKIR